MEFAEKKKKGDILLDNEQKILELYYLKGIGAPLPEEYRDFNPDIGILKDMVKRLKARSQDYIPPELKIDIEEIKSPSDLVHVSARIIRAVSAGDISYSLGQKLQSMLNIHMSLEESTTIQDKIDELKVAQKDVLNAVSDLRSGGAKRVQSTETKQLPEPVEEHDEIVEAEEVKIPSNVIPMPGDKKDV